MFMPFLDPHLVVGTAQINGRKHFSLAKLVQKVSNSWDREHVQPGLLVKGPKIHTHS